jgi:putative hydrolase of the HAD superfamily
VRIHDESRRIQRTLLIDADDTLWENNIYYLRCTAQFLDYVAAAGLDRVRAAETLAACEREVIPTMGYGPRGFIQALGMCYARLAEAAGLPADDDAVARARACGEAILDPPTALIGEAEYVLRALRPTSALVLVTKGDETHQRYKIERSGLSYLFDAEYIVAEKDPDTYRRIVAEVDADRETTWMVGNSPRSDINPAVEAGLGAVLIPHDHTWTAEVERIEHPEVVITLASLCGLLELFDIDAECAG